MSKAPYRFGGPVPEAVQRLKKRREYRNSSLYARVKKGRVEAAAKANPEQWSAVRDSVGELIGYHWTFLKPQASAGVLLAQSQSTTHAPASESTRCVACLCACRSGQGESSQQEAQLSASRATHHHAR